MRQPRRSRPGPEDQRGVVRTSSVHDRTRRAKQGKADAQDFFLPIGEIKDDKSGQGERHPEGGLTECRPSIHRRGPSPVGQSSAPLPAACPGNRDPPSPPRRSRSLCSREFPLAERVGLPDDDGAWCSSAYSLGLAFLRAGSRIGGSSLRGTKTVLPSLGGTVLTVSSGVKSQPTDELSAGPLPFLPTRSNARVKRVLDVLLAVKPIAGCPSCHRALAAPAHAKYMTIKLVIGNTHSKPPIAVPTHANPAPHSAFAANPADRVPKRIRSRHPVCFRLRIGPRFFPAHRPFTLTGQRSRPARKRPPVDTRH